MNKTIRNINPYKDVRTCKFNGAKAYLVETMLDKKSNYHLDFGAHDGELISSLKSNNLISIKL